MRQSGILACGALMLQAAAVAYEPDTFSDIDADRSGTIELHEADVNRALAASFEQADRDDDGKLSLREFAFAMARIRFESDPRQRG